MELWVRETVGDAEMWLMNLDHPEVERRVIEEMEAGVDVYYDRRWETAGFLVEWLSENREIFDGKRVLVLGAGVGAECVYLGMGASKVWVNDLAPVALELCGEQLRRNGVEDFGVLCGRYEELDLPEVDLVLGSFLVYNRDSLAGMKRFLGELKGDVILVNERLAEFKRLVKEEDCEEIFERDGMYGVRFTGGVS